MHRLAQLLLLATACGGGGGTREDFARDVAAARAFAISEFLRDGSCLQHEVRRCPSADGTILRSSNGLVWSTTAHDDLGRRTFQQSGGCLGRSPAQGISRPCPEPEETVRNLCAEVLSELHVSHGVLSLSCNGRPMLDWAFEAPGGTLRTRGFSLKVEAPARASDGVRVTVEHLDPDLQLTGCHSMEAPCTEALAPGDALWSPFELTRGASTRRCEFQLKPRFERGRCERCASAEPPPAGPR